MRCVICQQADVEPGTATVTLERDGMTLVVKHVLARVCPNCGEEYVNEAAAELIETAEPAVRPGVQGNVRDYASAV